MRRRSSGLRGRRHFSFECFIPMAEDAPIAGRYADRSPEETTVMARVRTHPGSVLRADICDRFITPALRRAGSDESAQIRQEVSFTKGRIIVRRRLVTGPGRPTSLPQAHPVGMDCVRPRWGKFPGPCGARRFGP